MDVNEVRGKLQAAQDKLDEVNQDIKINELDDSDLDDVAGGAGNFICGWGCAAAD